MILLINPLQRFLNNPLAVKMTLLGVICLFLFLFGAILIRKIRHDINAETAQAAAATSAGKCNRCTALAYT